MTRINLKDFYPWYKQDEYIEVPDAVAEAMLEAERLDRNYTRRVFYNKAHYSLDADDGIEADACFAELSPQDMVERQLARCRLCRALNSLPAAQGRRIEAHYILGMSKSEIAQAEGIDEKNVRQAITRGLSKMRKHIESF